ncbi:MAG: serine hydrolase domain-containing protein [Planctomycetota bacterium]
MKWILPAGLLAAALSCTGSAPPAALPADLAAALDPIFAAWDRDDGPGMTVAVLKEGVFVYLRGFGMADLENGVPNGPQTVFRIGSTSKQFTAACIALLVERGRLALDTPLAELFPEAPAWAAKVRIRHLAYHTSGIPDYLDLHEKKVFTPKESLDLILEKGAPRFPPGSAFEYSNSNYFLLGEIVSRVSGVPFPEFARRELFEPLGMAHTHFHHDHTHVVPHAAHGYACGRGAWKVVDTPLDHVGDGGLFTTAGDLARWAANLRSPVGGGRKWLALMTAPGWDFGPGPHGREGYAFGLEIRTGTPLGRVISHGGSWSGFNAEFLRLPDKNLAVIVLSNCDSAPATRLAWRVARALEGS